MDRKVLHNLKETPFAERETFNNAILLLSMVKSEFYYIVGFSRPDNIIEIGFDFEDEIYGTFSETVTLEFSSNSDGIKASAQLNNIVFENDVDIPELNVDNFSIEDGYAFYERFFEKDDVIPVSIEKLNVIILAIKSDVEKYEKQGYSMIANNSNKVRG